MAREIARYTGLVDSQTLKEDVPLVGVLPHLVKTVVIASGLFLLDRVASFREGIRNYNRSAAVGLENVPDRPDA